MAKKQAGLTKKKGPKAVLKKKPGRPRKNQVANGHDTNTVVVQALSALADKIEVAFRSPQKEEGTFHPILRNGDDGAEVMGKRTVNREWRNPEILMSKIGHLESHRDYVVAELNRIKAHLGI